MGGTYERCFFPLKLSLITISSFGVTLPRWYRIKHDIHRGFSSWAMSIYTTGQDPGKRTLSSWGLDPNLDSDTNLLCHLDMSLTLCKPQFSPKMRLRKGWMIVKIPLRSLSLSLLLHGLSCSSSVDLLDLWIYLVFNFTLLIPQFVKSAEWEVQL